MAEYVRDVDNLDNVFDKYLVDLKPYVLGLTDQTERQRAALWVKKLCEPLPAGITSRLTRNQHASALLAMLRRGQFEGPFLARPTPGLLPSLPKRLVGPPPLESHYGLANPGIDTSKPAPDWVEHELWQRHIGGGDSAEERLVFQNSTELSHRSSYSASQFSSAAPQYTHVPLPPYQERPRSHSNHSAPGNEDLHWQSKLHEERIKMQQFLDGEVQKILRRKNEELDKMKDDYNKKVFSTEQTIVELEGKLRELVTEGDNMRQSAEKQVVETRGRCEEEKREIREKHDKLMEELERRLQGENRELSRSHKEDLSHVVGETNSRLQRMEEEYLGHQKSLSGVITELESKIKGMEQQAMKYKEAEIEADKAKREGEHRMAMVTNDLEIAQGKCKSLEETHYKAMQNHDQTTKQMRAKFEAKISLLEKDYEVVVKDLRNKVEELQHEVKAKDEYIQEICSEKQRLIVQMQNDFDTDKLHLNYHHEQKTLELEKEKEDLERNLRSSVARLEVGIIEKDKELKVTVEKSKVHREKLLRENSEEMSNIREKANKRIDNLRRELEISRDEIQHGKKSRDKLTHDFDRKLRNVEKGYEASSHEQRIKFEQKKTSMLDNFHKERERTQRNHEKAIREISEKLEETLAGVERSVVEDKTKHHKHVESLQRNIASLKGELVEADCLRKQQLVELGVLREEERSRLQEEREAEIKELRTELSREKQRQEEEHAVTVNKAMSSVNDKVDSLEEHYKQRVNEVVDKEKSLKDEITRLRDQVSVTKNELVDSLTHNEVEQEALKKQTQREVRALRQELEFAQTKNRTLELDAREAEADHQQALTEVMFNYANKMKSMMPLAMQDELEDTIRSLRSQINMLQQKASLVKTHRSDDDSRLYGGVSPR